MKKMNPTDVVTIVLNRQTRLGRWAAIFCLGLLTAQPLMAVEEKLQSETSIVEAITHFVKNQYNKGYKTKLQTQKLDPHLRLTACSTELEIFYPVGVRKLGATTLGVRCSDDDPWKIYVPTQVQVYGPVVVTKRSLPRDTILHTDDVELAKRELSRATSGHYLLIDEVKGMILRQSLAKGSIVPPKALKQRHMVKRGDIITILAESDNILIRVKGKALMDGYRGQSIRIKNTRSTRELQGEVIDSGVVKVKM